MWCQEDYCTPESTFLSSTCQTNTDNPPCTKHICISCVQLSAELILKAVLLTMLSLNAAHSKYLTGGVTGRDTTGIITFLASVPQTHQSRAPSWCSGMGLAGWLSSDSMNTPHPTTAVPGLPQGRHVGWITRTSHFWTFPRCRHWEGLGWGKR